MEMFKLAAWTVDNGQPGEMFIDYFFSDTVQESRTEERPYVDTNIYDVREVTKISLDNAVAQSGLSFSDFFRKYLKTNLKTKQMPGFWRTEEMSYVPDNDAFPWKKTATKTYVWLVPTDVVVDRKRRGDWGHQRYFKTKKEGLDFLYKK